MALQTLIKRKTKLIFVFQQGVIFFFFFLSAVVLVLLCFVPTENGSFIIYFHSCQTPTSSYSIGHICSRRAMVISTCLSIIGALCSSCFSSVRKYVAREKWWENKDMQTDTQRNYFSSNKRIISPAERRSTKSGKCPRGGSGLWNFYDSGNLVNKSRCIACWALP